MIAIVCSCAEFLSFLATLAALISQFIVTANCFIISFLQFGQIIFTTDRNSFCNLNKYILQIGQMHFTFGLPIYSDIQLFHYIFLACQLLYKMPLKIHHYKSDCLVRYIHGKGESFMGQ